MIRIVVKTQPTPSYVCRHLANGTNIMENCDVLSYNHTNKYKTNIKTTETERVGLTHFDYKNDLKTGLASIMQYWPTCRFEETMPAAGDQR